MGGAQVDGGLTERTGVAGSANAHERVDGRLNADAIGAAGRGQADVCGRLAVGALGAEAAQAVVAVGGGAGHAGGAVAARVADARIDARQALRTDEVGRTQARVHVRVRLRARAAVGARTRAALVDVDLAQSARVARVALTLVAARRAQARAALTRLRRTVVDHLHISTTN